ncbi:hypothetical protein OC846_005339 [Tilletia horrida]|uniref:Uncharacterized protein n=1 Tax=Tilletia horrida TaxID=155126 RepID=A0AAN6GLZ9_9BASI|nr:hypothetical protein OC845_004975 [Tilletia horrida]KAK0546276.1 hypothetical protein OC846_005339 [Tilletia horrida]KAK0562941.1 hypothetical protein OC861_005074 [Tilletia horrida]
MSALASGAVASAPPPPLDAHLDLAGLPSSRVSGHSSSHHHHHHHHRRGASVQDLLTALGELPPPEKGRRPRSSTLASGAIAGLNLATDPDDGSAPVTSPLRHSDPATRQLVQSLTKRSRTLADAVAKRRESRTTSSTITTPPNEEQSPVEHVNNKDTGPINNANTRRRTLTPAAPASAPSIPLPPIPHHGTDAPLPPPSTILPRSSAPSAKAVTFGPVQRSHPEEADWSSDNDSVVWDALMDPARRRALAAARRSDTASGSNSSTPINSPRAILRNLQELQIGSSQLDLDHHAGSGLTTSSRVETVCESSDEEMLEDELSEMEHGLARVRADPSLPRRPSASESRRRGSQAADGDASQASRGLSRFETPDSTPTLHSEVFTQRPSKGLLEVPNSTEADQRTGFVRDRSRDSVSTATSESTAHSFDLRSRGNSTSTGASSVDAPQMQRSTSHSSSVTSNSRSKEATIPVRRDSLFVATPPVRIASLENLRAPLEHMPVHPPVQDSVEPASGLLGLSMTSPDPEEGGPTQQMSLPRKPALLGAWLDESVGMKRSNRPRPPGTLGWPDEGDSDESDGQRFVPRPIHGARKRLNSADSSIFSCADSEMASPLESDWQSPRASDSHERKSKSVSHTPSISPTFKPLLLPSESISRSQYRASSNRNMEMRSPYAGLQARSQAKLSINDIRLLPPTPQLEQLPYSNSQQFGHPSSQLPSAFAMKNAARYDPDNQSVSSIGFSHAPTPPITPSRPSYATSSEDPLSKARSPGMSSGSTPRTGMFGRASNASTFGTSSGPRVSEFGQMPTGMTAAHMSAGSEGVAPDAQAPYADPSGRLTPNWDSLDGQRSNNASIRMGKLRTTIFDSFGVKRAGQDPAAANERPQSPTDSAASHHGNEHSSSNLLTSLIRRASTTSHHHLPHAPAPSATSSYDSSTKLPTQHKHLYATMSTASSPSKRGGKLPALDRTTTSESHASASSSARRERMPSAESQTDLHTVASSSSRTKYSSRASTKSGPSSSAHGLASSNGSTRTGSQLSSPAIGGPERRPSETGTGTSSVRSGGSSQGGKSRSDKKPRPTKREDVAKVNNVLAELQAAGFMAPPKKKKTAASSSHPVSFRSHASKGSEKNSVQSR